MSEILELWSIYIAICCKCVVVVIFGESIVVLPFQVHKVFDLIIYSKQKLTGHTARYKLYKYTVRYTLTSPYYFIMFACSYVDDVVDYPPAQGGHKLYSTVEKKRVPSHDDDSTSGYPDIISTTQVC